MAKIDELRLIGEIAVKLGLITRSQLEECLALQRMRKEEDQFDRLGSIFLEKGYLDIDKLDIVLSHQQRVSEAKDRIGRYEIIAEIGRGAMGVVYRAKQIDLDREVALKVIRKGISQDRDYRKRFMREARIAASLNHPNIIRAIDAGETQQHFYFAMELFDSPNLLKILKRGKEPLGENLVLKVAIQMSRALTHAEEVKLVHRDIKPENILFDENSGMAKLTDMGLAKSTENEKANLTQAGSTLGTPYYISPESIEAEKMVDIRSDIYSLGATMYHLLTGVVPFEAETVFKILKKHVGEQPVPLRSRNPVISQEMNRIVLKTMEKDPDRRHQSPMDLEEDLVRLEKLGPEKAFAAAKAEEASPRPPKRRRRRGKAAHPLLLIGVPVTVAVVAGVILIAIAAGGGGGGDKPGPSKPGEEKKAAHEPSLPGSGSRKPDDPPKKAVDAEKEELAKIRRFAVEKPDDFDGIISRYKDLAASASNDEVAAKCIEEASEWEKRRHEARLRSLDSEFKLAEGLALKKEYGPAINVLNALQAKLPEGADLKKAKELESRFWDEARAQSKSQVLKAKGLARKGDYAGAAQAVRSVEAMGLPTVWKEVEHLVARYERMFRESQAVAFHRSVVEKAYAEGAKAAADFVAKAAAEGKARDADFEKSNLEKAGNRLEGLLSHIESLKGREVTLGLLQGGEVRGTLREISNGKAAIVGERGVTDWVELRSIDPAVARSGSALAEYAEACYLWYLAGPEARLKAYMLASGIAPGAVAEAPLLASRMGGVMDLDLSEEVDELAQAPAENAFRKSLEIIRSFRSTPFYAKIEAAVEKAFSTAASALGEDPDLLLAFSSRLEKSSGDRLSAVYDFVYPGQDEDFEFEGRGRWNASAGALRQTESATRASAMLSSSWSSLRLEAVMAGSSRDSGLVCMDRQTGVKYVLRVAEEEGAPKLLFETQKPGKSPEEAAKPLQLPVQFLSAKDSRLAVFIESDGASLCAGYRAGGSEKKTSAVKRHAAGAGMNPGVFADSCAVFHRISVAGAIDAKWLANLKAASKLKQKFGSGGWAELTLGAGSLEGLKTFGAVKAEAGAIGISGEHSGIELPRARRIIGDGMSMQFAFKARRVSDLGWCAISFFLGDKNLSWVLRTEVDETAPAGIPEDHAVASQGPFQDGAWHDVTLDVGTENGRIYIDGALREDFSLGMLADLQGSIKSSGFGLSVFGGSWEFKELRIRKLPR